MLSPSSSSSISYCCSLARSKNLANTIWQILLPKFLAMDSASTADNLIDLRPNPSVTVHNSTRHFMRIDESWLDVVSSSSSSSSSGRSSSARHAAASAPMALLRTLKRSTALVSRPLSASLPSVDPKKRRISATFLEVSIADVSKLRRSNSDIMAASPSTKRCNTSSASFSTIP